MSYCPNKQLAELIRDEKQHLLLAVKGKAHVVGLAEQKLGHRWWMLSLVDRQNLLLKRLELDL